MGFSDNMFLEKQNNPGLEVDLIDEISIQEINIIFKETDTMLLKFLIQK